MTARTYDGPEHESLRAAARSMLANFGEYGVRQVDTLLRAMAVERASELSPWGANYCRKVLQRQLPSHGDFA